MSDRKPEFLLSLRPLLETFGHPDALGINLLHSFLPSPSTNTLICRWILKTALYLMCYNEFHSTALHPVGGGAHRKAVQWETKRHPSSKREVVFVVVLQLKTLVSDSMTQLYLN